MNISIYWARSNEWACAACAAAAYSATASREAFAELELYVDDDPLPFVDEALVIITSLPIFNSLLATCGEDERFEEAKLWEFAELEDFGFD